MSLSGSINQGHGQTTEELTDRAVAALVREWGITETDARDAIERARRREQRLGPELAHHSVWDDPVDVPYPREPIDVTDPVTVA